MPSPYYRFLNLPDIFFDKDQLSFDLSKNIDRTKNKHWNNLNYVFNDKTFLFFSMLDCSLINSELFYTPPCGKLVWHIDMNPPEDFIKINLVWGSASHDMCWGELRDPAKSYFTSKTEVDTQYIKLSDEEVIQTETVQIIKPALVNIGRPHRILNYSDQGRWCLSSILTHNDQRLLFNDAIRRFNEYVVN